MNQQPDKIFREKLEGFHKPAPPAAWNKIEAGLQKKNNKVIWFRAAAAVSFVAVAGFLIWTSQSETEQLVAVNSTMTNEVKPAEQKTEQVIPTENATSSSEELVQYATEQPIAQTNADKHTEKIQQSLMQPDEVPAMNDLQSDTELLSFASEQIKLNDSLSTSLASTEDVNTIPVIAREENVSEESRVLVFSLEEVDSKYLDKEALAKATSSQKKASSFRKLLNKACDLKYNQDPFGDLRQKKNEILALNFKSEKRGQKK